MPRKKAAISEEELQAQGTNETAEVTEATLPAEVMTVLEMPEALEVAESPKIELGPEAAPKNTEESAMIYGEEPETVSIGDAPVPLDIDLGILTPMEKYQLAMAA